MSAASSLLSGQRRTLPPLLPWALWLLAVLLLAALLLKDGGA